MEIDERPSEPFLFFAADKTDPGAFNLPLYLAFADPMNTPGLILSPKMSQGLPLRDHGREPHRGRPRHRAQRARGAATRSRRCCATPSASWSSRCWSRATGEQAVAVATSRLHNIAGKYTGKDDPVMLVRTQMDFPGHRRGPGAVRHRPLRRRRHARLAPHAADAGAAEHGHQLLRRAAAGHLRGLLSMHEGRLTEPLDSFAHPFWDEVRDRVARQGRWRCAARDSSAPPCCR